MPSSYLSLLFLLSSCELFTGGSGGETGPLIEITETAYQRQIKAINACLEKGGETELTEEEKQLLLTEMQKEDGGICASYTAGVIEHPRVRRCKYGLFSLEKIDFCLHEAKKHNAFFKEYRDYLCIKAKQELKNLDEAILVERDVASSPMFGKVKDMNCGDEDTIDKGSSGGGR